MQEPLSNQLYSARLVIPNAREAIDYGALRVHDGIITAIGRRLEFPEKMDCPETNLGNVALIPGLVNAHAHLQLSCCRDRFQPGPFEGWLRQMVAVGRALGREEIVEGVTEGLVELARTGTTTIADISSDGLSLLGLEESGLRYVLFQEVIHLGRPPYDDFLRELEQRVFDLVPSPRGRIGLAPHAPYTVAEALMAELRCHFHEKEKMPFSMHVAESRAELQCLKHQTGALADFFREMGFYPPDSERVEIAPTVGEFLNVGNPLDLPRDVLVHGNFLSDAEVRDLASEGRSGLVLCPGTREFHGVRTRILEKAMRWALPVALGTDSLASNDQLNMWTEMQRSLGIPSRKMVSERTEPSWSAIDAFEAATIGGAQVLGMEDQIGQLEAGYRADFVSLALAEKEDPPLSRQDLLANWITQKQTPRIRGVWVEGEQILRRPLYA